MTKLFSRESSFQTAGQPTETMRISPADIWIISIPSMCDHFEYLKSLRPIASRLYELLGVKFYGHQKYIHYKYSTLCKLLPIRRQSCFSRARQQLEAGHAELKKTSFLKYYQWIPINEVKNDWDIKYVPGKRFFNETVAMNESSSDNYRAILIVDKGLNHEIDPMWSLFTNIVKNHPYNVS